MRIVDYDWNEFGIFDRNIELLVLWYGPPFRTVTCYIYILISMFEMADAT